MRPAASCIARRVAAGCAVALACAPLLAQAPDQLYLEVSVNGRPTGLVMQFGGAAGTLRTSAANLRQLGVAPAVLGAAEGEVALDRIAGLRYTIDNATQSIALVLDDAVRAPYMANARAGSAPPEASASPGALFNYDAVAQFGEQSAALMTGELRAFNDRGAFTTSGSLRAARDGNQALRYESYWQSSDPATLRSLQVGDLISGSLPWSRALRMGGIQWRKNFGLRPDLLTYPTASLSGSALVPSALSLYVNGVQQFSGQVPDGPFVLGQVAGLNGAGEASVVTRDALGRATVTSLPLYVDTRLLASGLEDYSVELGVARRNFGQRSFDYGKPQLSASLRRGASDGLTVEAHGEAGTGLLNGGAGVLLALGGYGVLSAHAAASGGAAHGRQGALGYQYLTRRFSVDAYTERASAGFADLATGEGAPAIRAQNRVALNLALGGQQNLSLSHVGYRPASAREARINAVSYGVTLGRRVFASLSAFRDARNRASRGVYASLSFALGERTSASAGAGRQNGLQQRSLQLLRTPDFGGGFGWTVQAAQFGTTRYGQAQVRYLGEAGQVGASAYTSDGKQRLLLEGSGALVAMDGTVSAARQVGSGFALVSTGMAGIPVTHENRIIGLTSRSGHLLVPNLNPYTANRVGIDVGELAADARVPLTGQTVVPRNLSGVLVRLAVERYRAASVILRSADGKLLPPGTPLRHRESGSDTVVGHDGLAFVDRLQKRNTLEAGEGEGRCIIQFKFEWREDVPLPVLGPFSCVPGSKP